MRTLCLLSAVLALALVGAGDVAPPGKAERPEASPPPHVVLVIGESHGYDAEGSLRGLAAELQAKHALRCTVLQEKGYTDIPGLEALKDADLAIFYIRRHPLPPEQMKHVQAYLDAGKPLIAFRTSSHAFQSLDGKVPDGVVRWDRFDQEVLGCHYGGHAAGDSEVRLVPEAAEHPILRGIQGPYRLPETLYRSRPLAATCQVLMMGKSLGTKMPDEPVAWTNTYKGGRVFYTSMGARATFQEPWFRTLLVNAVYWALNRPVPGA